MKGRSDNKSLRWEVGLRKPYALKGHREQYGIGEGRKVQEMKGREQEVLR